MTRVERGDHPQRPPPASHRAAVAKRPTACVGAARPAPPPVAWRSGHRRRSRGNRGDGTRRDQAKKQPALSASGWKDSGRLLQVPRLAPAYQIGSAYHRYSVLQVPIIVSGTDCKMMHANTGHTKPNPHAAFLLESARDRKPRCVRLTLRAVGLSAKNSGGPPSVAFRDGL